MEKLNEIQNRINLFIFCNTVMTVPEKIIYTNYILSFRKIVSKIINGKLLSADDLNKLFFYKASAKEYVESYTDKNVGNVDYDSIGYYNEMFTWYDLNEIITNYGKLRQYDTGININNERIVLVFMYEQFGGCFESYFSLSK
jgi:hypothetical protein